MLNALWRARAGHPFLGGAPLLMAHRGGAGLAPENTMAAFRRALKTWDADVLEMDVRTTADGRLVVLHDATVDRTTDGRGQVSSLPWNDVRSLDAGFRFRDLDGAASFRGRGLGIPLFAEVLETFPHARLIVEPKVADAARPLRRAVATHGAEHRVLVGAEFEAARRRARGHRGPWGASRRQVAFFWAMHRVPLVWWLGVPAVDALEVPERSGRVNVVTPAFVRRAHRANLPVHVWTIDAEEDMRRLLGCGVDGIQTDRPDRLARVLAELHGRPLPPGLAQTGRGS